MLIAFYACLTSLVVTIACVFLERRFRWLHSVIPFTAAAVIGGAAAFLIAGALADSEKHDEAQTRCTARCKGKDTIARVSCGVFAHGDMTVEYSVCESFYGYVLKTEEAK